MATLVNVARANFGGDLSLVADRAARRPDHACRIDAGNLDTIPVVFEATPAAPLAALGRLT